MGRQDGGAQHPEDADAGPQQGDLAANGGRQVQDQAPNLGKRKRSSDVNAWTTDPSPVKDIGYARRHSAFDPIRDSAASQPTALVPSGHSLPEGNDNVSSASGWDRYHLPSAQSSGRKGSFEASNLEGRTAHKDIAALSDHDSGLPMTSGSGINSERKKRQFARRTKTGCFTCRKRKKKCDEAKPICENCARGKFACGGYTDGRAGFERDVPPLFPSERPLLQPSRSDPPSSIDTSRSSVSSGNMQEHSQPAYARRGSVPWQTYPEPPRAAIEVGSRSYMPAGMPQMPPGRPVDPKWTMPRWESQGSLPLTVGSAATLGPATARSGHRADRPSTMGEHRRPGYHDGGPAVGKDELLVARDRVDSAKNMSASVNLDGSAATSQFQISAGKEKMFSGQPYPHFSDPDLRKDRAACASLLERFNEAAKASEYCEDPERNGQLLRAVVAPLDLQRRRHPVGSVGWRAIIEAPLTCDYGYNIHIGDDVVIGAGCVMLDPCKISIGNRTVIGPNVKFYGMSMSMDYKLRQGGRSFAVGGPIIIEEDCFIGGDVIIMPNRTIKRGSVVGAGTVVSKDVQAGTVVAGSPMRFIRKLRELADDTDQHAPHIQAENDAILSTMNGGPASSRSSFAFVPEP